MGTPTQQVLAAASGSISTRDATGRELVLRKLNALDRLRLFKALGPVLAQNTMYLGMASLASAVVSVDAVPVPVPTNEAQIEALVARLGDAGLAAVADAMGAAEAADTAAGDDALGNSAGTPI